MKSTCSSSHIVDRWTEQPEYVSCS